MPATKFSISSKKLLNEFQPFANLGHTSVSAQISHVRTAGRSNEKQNANVAQKVDLAEENSTENETESNDDQS